MSANGELTDQQEGLPILQTDSQGSSQTPSFPPPRLHHSQTKRPFADTFTAGFDESNLSHATPEGSSFLFDSFISPKLPRSEPQKKSTPSTLSDCHIIGSNASVKLPPNVAGDLETAAEKAVTLVQSVGACAYASADFVSSLLIIGKKQAYSYLNRHNEDRFKRRRLLSDSAPLVGESQEDNTMVETKFLAPNGSFIFFDTSGLPPATIPGAFGCDDDEDETKGNPESRDQIAMEEEQFNLEYLDGYGSVVTPAKEGMHIFASGTPMDLEDDLSTPLKQTRNGEPPVPKTFRPLVTPSFKQNGLGGAPGSSTPNKYQPDTKAARFIDGLRRHKLGILNHQETSFDTSDHSIDFMPTRRESVPMRYIGLDTYEGAKTFRFDQSRLAQRQPLPYAGYHKLPPVELPEETETSEQYVDLYMKLVAQREKREKAKKEQDLEEKKKAAAAAVPLLDAMAIRKTENIWARTDSSTELVFAYRIGISVYDLGTLRDGHWLNDNIIDFYLAMITDRSQRNPGKYPSSFAFSTHFFSTLQTRGYAGVARWAKRKGVDVTKLDYIFVPINRQNTHWCLAVINNRDMRFEFYDSMNGAGTQALKLLREYMYAQTMATYPGSNTNELGYDKYDMCPTLKCPQQKNSHDCGVFVSKMVEVLSKNVHITSFSQRDMPNLRRLMAYEISQNKLL